MGSPDSANKGRRVSSLASQYEHKGRRVSSPSSLVSQYEDTRKPRSKYMKECVSIPTTAQTLPKLPNGGRFRPCLKSHTAGRFEPFDPTLDQDVRSQFNAYIIGLHG
eukprot:1474321-Pyramimonas_sp.AAC.1